MVRDVPKRGTRLPGRKMGRVVPEQDLHILVRDSLGSRRLNIDYSSESHEAEVAQGTGLGTIIFGAKSPGASSRTTSIWYWTFRPLTNSVPDKLGPWQSWPLQTRPLTNSAAINVMILLGPYLCIDVVSQSFIKLIQEINLLWIYFQIGLLIHVCLRGLFVIFDGDLWMIRTSVHLN